MSNAPRLAALDGLRGIAILLVVWYHVWEITWLPVAPAFEFLPETGFAGVDLFFFLSGFVIAYPFVRAHAAGTEAPSWRHFTERRFLKIVPSYVLSIVGCFAIGYAAFPSAGAALTAIATHLLFIHTWFGDTFGAINGVLWSLAVEVQFYLVFPLIWWCFRRAPLATGGTMIAAALGWRHLAAACCLHVSAPRMIDNLPGFLDLFAFGMLGAWTFVRAGAWPQTAPRRALATGLALAGVALFVLLGKDLYALRFADMWDTAWQVDKRTLWGAAFFLIALGTLLGNAWWRAFVGNPFLVWCGAISYNWYLWHQVVARELLAHRIPPFAGSRAVEDHGWQVAFTAIAVAGSALLAAALTVGFERPLLRGCFRLPGRPALPDKQPEALAAKGGS